MINEPAIRKILTVFLASPSDLVEERTVAREVVEKINRSVNQTLGWHIDLLGWEDTLPESGRPQELINKDVDSCDLFLGMLWRRWGSTTGYYSSGFEEEFERAKKRAQKTQLPNIWLCFKDVETAQTQDPGEQLSKVLVFRDIQIKSKEYLFKSFKNIEDWRNKLDEWLLKYVLLLYKESLQNEQSESSSQLLLPSENQASISLLAESSEQNDNDATKQIISLTGRINQSLSSYEAKDSLSWFEIARLSSFSRTLLMRRNDDEFFSNHEIHLIYQYRSQLKATLEEKIQIFRTIITDTNAEKVGWYWYKEANVTDLLFSLASISNSGSQKQAIKILESAKVCLTLESEKYDEILRFVLLDHPTTIKVCWLSYLGVVGRFEDLSIANRACSDDDSLVCAAAESAKILILIRHTPNDAFIQLLENRVAISDLIVTQLRNQSKSLSEENLLKGLKHRNSEIRLISLEKLVEKQSLSESQLRELLNDSSNVIKRICYEEIIRLGGDVSLKTIKTNFGENWILQNELLTTFFIHKPLQYLEWEANGFLSHSYIAYKVIATEHFDYISERLREDLENEFANFAKQHIEQRIMSEFNDLKILDLAEDQVNIEIKNLIKEQLEWINKIIEERENLFDKYNKYEFIGAALTGILLHGNHEDIKWGRKYLVKSSDIINYPLTEAIQIVEKYGDSSDVVVLIDIAKEKYGELSNLAAQVAIKLSAGINETALELLRSEKPNLVRVAIKSFETADRNEVREILEPFLRKENRLLHSYALLYFLKYSSHEELEALLDRYLQGRYYYHIVCLIDRILYAHSPYREMYLNKFEDELNQYFKY